MSKSTLILRCFFLGVPTVVVTVIAFLVLFSEQGLLELARTEEQLASVRMDIASIEAKNQALEIQIRRLRSSPTQVELITAGQLDRAKSNTTVYRFTE